MYVCYYMYALPIEEFVITDQTIRQPMHTIIAMVTYGCIMYMYFCSVYTSKVVHGKTSPTATSDTLYLEK